MPKLTAHNWSLFRCRQSEHEDGEWTYFMAYDWIEAGKTVEALDDVRQWGMTTIIEFVIDEGNTYTLAEVNKEISSQKQKFGDKKGPSK